MNTTAGYVIMYNQNDVMMFKRHHLVLISINLPKAWQDTMSPPEVINKLTLKRASKKVSSLSRAIGPLELFNAS